MSIGCSRYELPIGSLLAPHDRSGGPEPANVLHVNNGVERSSPKVNEQIRQAMERAAIARLRKLVDGS